MTTTATFTFTGAPQSFVVPAGVTSLTVDLYGGEGGPRSTTSAGLGGRVQGVIPVTAGETLTVFVAGRGPAPDNFNNTLGGYGENPGGGASPSFGGGGGSSAIRRGVSRLAVAGGGGAAGNSTTGGFGGGLNGGGPSPGGQSPRDGGDVGQGYPGSSSSNGGGGGAGFYGGGGGANSSEGSGGSSLVPAGGSTSVGVRGGDGVAVLTYNRPPTGPGVPSVSPNPVNTTGTISWGAASDPDGDPLTYDVELSTNGGASFAVIASNVGALSTTYNFGAQPSTTTAVLRVRARDSAGEFGPYATGGAFTIQHNVAPNAPGGLTPNTGTVERTQVQRLQWVFSDPDAGDTQSKWDVQWRVGAGAFTLVSQTTTSTFWDAPASTFPNGSVEWQVRTYDSQGAVGPYSASAFFTAGTTPGLPIITSPANNSPVSQGSAVLAWSIPAQEAFQVRTVGDAAGAPDTATIYTDSGVVESATARDRLVTFAVNNRAEHAQVRVRNTGLWSGWASVRVSVSFTTSLLPLVLATPLPQLAAIQLALTNPTGNLLTANQSSLETDTTGWTSANATVARSTAQSLVGAASLAVTVTAAGDAFFFLSQDAPVTSGRVFTAVASVRSGTVGRTVRLRIDWYAGATYQGTTGAGADYPSNTAGWQQARITAQAPVNATLARVVGVVSAAAAAEVHFVDAVGLFATPTGNLVTNPDFESTLPAGGATAATVALSTAQAYTGRQSLAMTSTAATGLFARDVASVPVIAGQTYAVSAWLHSTSAATAPGLTLTFTSGQAQIAVNGTAGSGWHRVVSTFTATASGSVVPMLRATSTAVGQTVYADAVQVVVGSQPVDYLPPTTSNLATNPSAEVDTAGWSGPVTRTTADAFIGSACFLYAGSNTQAVSAPVSMKAGQTYAVQVRVKNAGSTATLIRLSAGATIIPTTPIAAGLGWTLLTGTVTSPADQTFMTFDSNNLGNSLYIDAVQVEQGSVATPYVDGSLGAGYVWEASENLLGAAASSFEDVTVGGWASAGNATLTNSAAQAFSGTKSLSVASGAAGNMTAIGGDRAGQRAVAGTTYTFSAYVRAATVGRETFLVARFVNAANNAVTFTAESAHLTTATSGWLRLSVTCTPPAGTDVATFDVQVSVLNTIAAGEVTYIDAVQVEQKPYATAYAAPGTPHASTSGRQFPWVIPPPAVASNAVYRREVGQLVGERIAAGLAPNAVWLDRTPASDVEYEYQAAALGVNGTLALSPWTR